MTGSCVIISSLSSKLCLTIRFSSSANFLVLLQLCKITQSTKRITIFVLAKFKKGVFEGKNTSFMITKKELKQINSLATKKARKTEQQFLVEGKKSVEEFIAGGFQPKKLFLLFGSLVQ